MHPPILAIDTSCDETAVAVTQGNLILSNVVASQVELHKPYGGVFPTVAKLAHRENLPAASKLALKRAGITPSELAAVAVTQGPGLAPALEVGIEFAKQLAKEWDKPLIAVNHVEGHLLSVLARPRPKTSLPATPEMEAELPFPILGVIVSGKHNDFVRINGLGQYQLLGSTIDDAAGEALDKVGRMLDLGYPAGPVIEEFAKRGNARAIEFPLPMTTSGDFNVSFSGMKTFARNKIEALSGEASLSSQTIYDFCASFQRAVIRAILYKLNKILQTESFGEVWLGGGVAANTALRSELRAMLKPYGLKLKVPYTKKLCGDNAAMIGIVAGYKLHRGEVANPSDLDRRPRWNLNELSAVAGTE